MSDSQRSHGLQPTRLPRPWDLPGKSTGVGCHCLLPDIVQAIAISIHGIAVLIINIGFPGGASGKEPAFQCRRHRDTGSSLGREDPLEEDMAFNNTI